MIAKSRKKSQRAISEPAVDEIDREVKSYAPRMAASTKWAEVGNMVFLREVSAEDCQTFEAPGDMLALHKSQHKSFESDLLMGFAGLRETTRWL